MGRWAGLSWLRGSLRGYLQRSIPSVLTDSDFNRRYTFNDTRNLHPFELAGSVRLCLFHSAPQSCLRDPRVGFACRPAPPRLRVPWRNLWVAFDEGARLRPDRRGPAPPPSPSIAPRGTAPQNSGEFGYKITPEFWRLRLLPTTSPPPPSPTRPCAATWADPASELPSRGKWRRPAPPAGPRSAFRPRPARHKDGPGWALRQ